MKLYHGSKKSIPQPIVGGSKIDNDYGPAFYLTRDLSSAHEWACRNNTVGIVNEYEFNEKGLKILDLRKQSVLNWLAVLLHFRTLDKSFIKSFKTRLDFIEEHYYIDVKDYDLVIGYRADDAYFRFPLDFARGNITLEQLEESFHLGKLSDQYVIMSDRGMKRLKYIRSFDSSEEYINRYYYNVINANKRFDDLSKDSEGTRIIDIMRNEK